MPQTLDRSQIDRYVESFSQFQQLKEQGFSFLVDVSGTLFKATKPSLKDVAGNAQAIPDCSIFHFSCKSCGKAVVYICNLNCFAELPSWQAIEAVLLCMSRGRFSAHILAEAICAFYQRKSLFPKGILAEMECIQEWSKRMGLALQRLDS